MSQDAVFGAVAQQQVFNRRVQKYKYHYSYLVSSTVAPATTDPQTLTISQDADFQIEKITGSCYGPCSAAGVPTASNTDFPMPGIAAGAGFAGRGLTVKIIDAGNSRELVNGFMPAELFLTPGYGIQMYLPFPIKYFAKRNTTLQFDIRNRDTQVDANHHIDIALHGYKFQMPENPDNLNPNAMFASGAQVAGR